MRCGSAGVLGVEEPVEGGEGVGVGLADLPGLRQDRDGETGGLSAAEPDVQVDTVGLVQGTSSTRRTVRVRSRCGVSGVDQSVGKSVAKERIDLSLRSSVRRLLRPRWRVGSPRARFAGPVGRQSSRLPGWRRRAGVGGDGQVAAAVGVGAVAGAFDVPAAQRVGVDGGDRAWV